VPAGVVIRPGCCAGQLRHRRWKPGKPGSRDQL